MKKNLSIASLLFLTVVVSSCSFDIKKIHPHFLDVPKGYARIYEAKKIEASNCGDPEYKFVYTGEKKSIDEMNGYACLPVEEVQYLLKHYDEYNRKKCTNENRGSTITTPVNHGLKI